MKKLRLCIMTQKGLATLLAVLEIYPKSEVQVFIGQDDNVQNDFSNEIIYMCQKHNVSYEIYRNKQTILPDDEGSHTIAISWKWLIKLEKSTLIVFHDSLLPKYRGFNPLVSMLINKERSIGVSAIYGATEYDTGDIIAQASRDIDYPILISTAIDIICEVYRELATHLCLTILSGDELQKIKQNESEATYSLWRDDTDYLVNWGWSASKIARMIDAVGFPYSGARAETICGLAIRINSSRISRDVTIENRDPGKIIFWDDEGPTVVCGKELLKLTDYEIVGDQHSGGKENLKFRSRFKWS